ncbi:MAG: hypothetical protein WCI27_10135 [Candidatus Omnitrophota bacterium]
MKLVRVIFFLCAVSYLFYAVLFGFFAPGFFQYVNIAPPNHWGYVHFIAATSFIFALMSFKVAKDPVRGKELIPYVIMYKFFYTVVIFINKIIYDVPDIWVIMAVLSSIFTAILIGCYFYVKCPSHSCSKE